MLMSSSFAAIPTRRRVFGSQMHRADSCYRPFDRPLRQYDTLSYLSFPQDPLIPFAFDLNPR